MKEALLLKFVFRLGDFNYFVTCDNVPTNTPYQFHVQLDPQKTDLYHRSGEGSYVRTGEYAMHVYEQLKNYSGDVSLLNRAKSKVKFAPEDAESGYQPEDLYPEYFSSRYYIIEGKTGTCNRYSKTTRECLNCLEEHLVATAQEVANRMMAVYKAKKDLKNAIEAEFPNAQEEWEELKEKHQEYLQQKKEDQIQAENAE